MSANRKRAKKMMVYYLRMIAQRAGLKNWNGENNADIEELVDCLIDAAKQEMRTDTDTAHALGQTGGRP